MVSKIQPAISAAFPFESKFINVKGSKMHYIDEGQGDPVIFLHGNPTSSYLWRNIVPYLIPHARCIAVDNIGMGKSDKPDINYGFADTADYLEAFIDKLDLHNITLVIHDWGGILGFDYANRHRDRVKAIAFMEASIDAPRYESMPTSVKIALRMMRSPLFGSLMVKYGNIMIKKLLPDLISRDLTKEEQAHYAAPYPTPSSRKPLLRWPQDVPIQGSPQFSVDRVRAYAAWLRETDIPKLCLYVTPGVGFQAEDLKIVQQTFRNTDLVYLGEGLHFIQEDFPHEIGQALEKWFVRIH